MDDFTGRESEHEYIGPTHCLCAIAELSALWEHWEEVPMCMLPPSKSSDQKASLLTWGPSIFKFTLCRWCSNCADARCRPGQSCLLSLHKQLVNAWSVQIYCVREFVYQNQYCLLMNCLVLSWLWDRNAFGHLGRWHAPDDGWESVVLLIFLDFSAALDTIGLWILLDFLSGLGLGGMYSVKFPVTPWW